MGCLVFVLVAVVAALSGLFVPLLIAAGWLLAIALAVVLAVWLIGRVIGIALVPLWCLAEAAVALRRAKKNDPRGWSGEIPRRGDPRFDEYLAWANHEEFKGHQGNGQSTPPKHVERRSPLAQFVRKGR